MNSIIPTLTLSTLMFAVQPGADNQGLPQAVATRVQQFVVQCYKWQTPARCDYVVATARLTIVDDYTFRTNASATGLAAGLYTNLQNIKVARYNKINTDDPARCLVLIRDRQAMSAISGGKKYWLTHPNSLFCADTSDILPSMGHELCHFFGVQVGHKPGKEECQS